MEKRERKRIWDRINRQGMDEESARTTPVRTKTQSARMGAAASPWKREGYKRKR